MKLDWLFVLYEDNKKIPQFLSRFIGVLSISLLKSSYRIGILSSCYNCLQTFLQIIS